MAEPGALDRARLTQLAGMLATLRSRVRYVDYRQAEDDCERLAAEILARIPRSELERFRFAAIPRGGLIVLGMLSYLLDLRPPRLQPDPSSSEPLVLVDDGSLTGLRFAQHLERTASREVVFAHLYSHPDLRRAVIAREDRVRDCLAAHDLADLADVSPLNLKQWRERLGPERYWLGRAEPVCFAWNEPNSPFWNPATERVEDGWRFLPPHLCLKTRAVLGGDPPPMAAPRQWRAPADLVTGTFDGVLWLCRAATGEVISLSSSGADLWRWLACWGTIEEAAQRLAAVYQVDPETARKDTYDFAINLETAGFLERSV